MRSNKNFMLINYSQQNHIQPTLDISNYYFQTVESSRAQDKIEIEHLTEMLAKAKEKAERDKEALKKATR